MDELSPRRARRGHSGSVYVVTFVHRLILLLLLALGTWPRRARAACSLGDAGTNCRFFFSDTPSFAINNYADGYVNSASFFQVGLRSTPTSGWTVTNLEYSYNGTFFIPFPNPAPPVSLTSGNGTVSGLIQDIDTIESLPFFIRYVIPANVPNGTMFTVTFRSNTDGYSIGGFLAENPDPDNENNFVQTIRRQSSIAPTQSPTVRPTIVSPRTCNPMRIEGHYSSLFSPTSPLSRCLPNYVSYHLPTFLQAPTSGTPAPSPSPISTVSSCVFVCLMGRGRRRALPPPTISSSALD